MGKIRINIPHAIGLLIEGKGRQTTLDDEILEDLREALRAGEWEIVDRLREEAMDADRISKKQEILKEKLVKEKGWFVPSMHGWIVEDEERNQSQSSGAEGDSQDGGVEVRASEERSLGFHQIFSQIPTSSTITFNQMT